MANVVDLTDTTFDAETSQGVALVDFWAPWCGPCRLQHPILDALVQKLQGRAKVSRVNVDDNARLASRFNVASIPTLLVLKDGKEVARHVGVTDERKLTASIEKNL